MTTSIGLKHTYDKEKHIFYVSR